MRDSNNSGTLNILPNVLYNRDQYISLTDWNVNYEQINPEYLIWLPLIARLNIIAT